MRIAVLEWICGGGLSDQRSAAIASELLDDGQAMLRCLVDGIQGAGYSVAFALDARLEDRLPESDHADRFFIPLGAAPDEVLESWKSLAEQCDWTIVIAPESEGILEHVIATLAESSAINLVNCRGEGLQLCCDKLQFSGFCEQVGIAHPATRRASEIDDAWLEATSRSEGNAEWAIKPIDGAGCESLQRLTRTQLMDRVVDLTPEQRSKLIIQPWRGGQAYSCACIVDRDARWHWLPLQEQLFAEGAQPKYLGGRFASLSCVEGPRQILDCLASKIEEHFPSDFRGWIGVDLVHNALAEIENRWSVIEINPRCTTSIVGLTPAYRGRGTHGNLAGFLVRSQSDGNVNLEDLWRPIAFSANGATRVIPEAVAQRDWETDQS